ncbi:MAG: hypothetical protein IAE78_03870, partial [Myxococcus sp.]|nr:hypothetical protein [Myxococcus sp.]
MTDDPLFELREELNDEDEPLFGPAPAKKPATGGFVAPVNGAAVPSPPAGPPAPTGAPPPLPPPLPKKPSGQTGAFQPATSPPTP